jgi:hypothetical protein
VGHCVTRLYLYGYTCISVACDMLVTFIIMVLPAFIFFPRLQGRWVGEQEQKEEISVGELTVSNLRDK